MSGHLGGQPTAIEHPPTSIIIHESWIHRPRTPGPDHGRAAGLPWSRSDRMEQKALRRLPSWARSCACLWPRARCPGGKKARVIRVRFEESSFFFMRHKAFIRPSFTCRLSLHCFEAAFSPLRRGGIRRRRPEREHSCRALYGC